ncbi:MAG TPA: hybrid sensor histidine kinase/response regulator [Cyanobacteria bacterium UBA11149]|nr:hybrid sensor histidine kinase/response regulator [Cyanobacteria bacterium UBA11367]HBE61011.1 hybrid sensor histidine kinase/response regulator [Cyanobacteria bacterium UBA11366]HBK65959.1 hybrid sensor histidine kinase/response regulator [Cyanobacteria bacterium UBA11166]HBR74293.1 hybrid sensor histidine kinase/response regulator [Cyanobacteria bacterium UBA11159]HBS69329.1 hybrid sensor histidine kinase/response regulator [Cyanobacteria bacterium UBA11153]HBW88116.1 hybrid sensor histid
MNQIKIIPGNILIIDDKRSDIQLLSQTLSDRGYTVRGAAKGKMGIKAAQADPPDLILLDIRMPDLDGYAVCEQLKSHPKTQDIPIIFLSALDDVLDKVRAFQIGAVDYITKPFQIDEVLARVNNQIIVRHLTKQLIEKSQQLESQNQQLQQEIIERRKAEKTAEAASKAKSDFVANMSHELRTPLNAILGFTQLMNRDKHLRDEQQEYLEIINRSGEYLLGLIDDVLELSKIESGRFSLNLNSFDFYRFLDSIEEMFQMKAEQKGLYLMILVSSAVPQYIKTDQQKLRGCLINLIGNAIKFTQSGGVVLQVRLGNGEWQSRYQNREEERQERENEEYRENRQDEKEKLSSSSHSLIFEVKDTGSGIAPDEINTIFQAFAQTETGRNSEEGAGLGLAITQKFVLMMGGEITVSSTVGKGTTFKFNIKLESGDKSGIIAKARQRAIGLQPNQERYRILVVDDTRENRLLLIKLLQPIGFEVIEAENGEEAINKWLAFQPHLIWMDTRMPIMNGIETTQAIRSREEKLKKSSTSDFPLSTSSLPHTIIIALSASAFEERRGEVLAAGCDDFVRKPFTEEVIFDKIGQYLGVRYIYEDLPESSKVHRSFNSSGEQSDSFLLEKMAIMPSNWLQELEYAAKNLDEDLVIQLIEKIPETNLALAEALRDLNYNFRLDVILRLVQLSIKS